MRERTSLVHIIILLALCLLARQAEAHLKILTAPGHPLFLVLAHREGIIQEAYIRSPEGVRSLEQIHHLFLGSDTHFALRADGDLIDDLVWRIDLQDPRSGETFSLWITSVSEVSTAWIAIAPSGPTLWDDLPPLANNRKDTFLYIAPHLPGYYGLEEKSGPQTLTFVYTMALTTNGPKMVAVPAVYTRLLPLASLVSKGQEDETSTVSYRALYQDFERMARGGMPSREAMDNFLWKRILTIRWKR